MTITASIYEFAVFLVAVAFLILMIAAIPMVIQLKRTVRSLEELSNESKAAVESLNRLLRNFADEAEGFSELSKRVRNAGHKAASTFEAFVDTVKSPLVTIVSLIMGIELGLKHLLKKEKDKKGGGEDVRR